MYDKLPSGLTDLFLSRYAPSTASIHTGRINEIQYKITYFKYEVQQQIKLKKL